MARYRNLPPINGDTQDVHRAAAGSSCDRWSSRHGGSGLSYDPHFTCLGRVQMEMLSGRPGGDVVELIVHRLDMPIRR